MISRSGNLAAPKRIPPATVIAAAILLGVLVVFTVLHFATSPPWLGLTLQPAPDRNGVMVVGAKGPAEPIPVGTVFTRISADGHSESLGPFDLTIEPDGSMGDYGRYALFLDRQSALARILQASSVSLSGEDGRDFRISPAKGGRPLLSLPPVFWVQLVVGLVAWLVSAAVFAFRPGESSARYLLLSGASTLLFSPAAAIYTTRELALDGTLFRWASDLNFFGGSMFAASFVGLLLHYPRRIAPGWVGVSVVGLYLAWFVLQQFGFFESMTLARRLLVMIGVFSTFVLAGAHWHLTRRDPVARAALQWFLLSWMLGTCTFCLFILLPQLFGVDTSPLQGYAFLLFLLVYGGLAFGILRYRLFDLGTWWRRVVVWSTGVLMLIVFDLTFLFGLGFSTGVSLSLTLAICGMVWLPLRSWIWHRFSRRTTVAQGEWLRKVINVALASSDAKRRVLWRELAKEIFDPLVLEAENPGVTSGVVLENHGQGLRLPACGAVEALSLEYAWGGRRLFTPTDVRVAQELLVALAYALEGRHAYDAGVREERTRIARDIHDNIGAQLLSALHSAHPEGKDRKIRETIVDLRDVINNIPANRYSVDETFAELRCETFDRLEAAGISLEWVHVNGERALSDTTILHALRSVIREAVSNIIHHAEATHARVSLEVGEGGIVLDIRDNGKGMDASAVSSGNGLPNMRARVSVLGGDLVFSDAAPGTRVTLRLPCSPTLSPP